MSSDENFTKKLAELLVRQERNSRNLDSSIASENTGFKSVAQILGSTQYWDRFSWLKKEDEHGKE